MPDAYLSGETKPWPNPKTQFREPLRLLPRETGMAELQRQGKGHATASALLT